MDEILMKMERLQYFFEIDGSQVEGEGWWVSMSGFYVVKSMEMFNFEIFWASGAVGSRLLCSQVIKQPVAHRITMIYTPPFRAAAYNQEDSGSTFFSSISLHRNFVEIIPQVCH